MPEPYRAIYIFTHIIFGIKLEIFKFIEIFYNRQRLHQTLNYVTPEMMELKGV